MAVKLFDYVKVIDPNHKDFGRVGKLTDYDTIDKEFSLFFDKITENGQEYWSDESTWVKNDQVERSSKTELERI